MGKQETTFEMKFKTDITSFEKELRAFATEYREDRLEDVEVSELGATGKYGERSWHVSLLHRDQSKAITKDSFGMHVSQISRDTHPLRMRVPLVPHSTLSFAVAFTNHCRKLWDGRKAGRESYPLSDKDIVKRAEAISRALNGVTATDVGGWSVLPKSKTNDSTATTTKQNGATSEQTKPTANQTATNVLPNVASMVIPTSVPNSKDSRGRLGHEKLPQSQEGIGTRRVRVFLCHSSGDKPSVRELYQRLKTDGVDPWLDEENLLPGQEWQREITKAVRNSDAVVVCLSSRSVQKTGYLQREIKEILDVADEQPEDTIFLIPLRLEDCEIPERLKKLHRVDLYDERGFEKLMQALQARAKALRIQT